MKGMRVKPAVWLLVLLPWASGLQANESDPASADEQVIWLDERWEPVDSADEASHMIRGWEEVEGGDRAVIRDVGGAPFLEANVQDALHFKEDELYGEYRLFDDQASVKETGHYNSQGQRHGLVIGYHPEGSVAYEAHYEHGEVHGPFTRYYPDGVIKKKGAYDHDQLADGEVRWYDEQGELTRIQHYENGEANGLEVQYQGGLRRHHHYVDGQLEGVQRAYIDETDQLMRETSYRDGVEHGIHRRWRDDGQLLTVTHYAEGRRHGEHLSYSATGQLEQRGEYREGVRFGEQQYYHDNGTLKRVEIFTDDRRPVEERDYTRDGQLTRRSVEQSTDYGPGRLEEQYYANGELKRRQQTTDDRSWRLIESFDETGALTERRERLDGDNVGRHISTNENGDRFITPYVDGHRHGQFQRVSRDGEVMASGTYDHGLQVGDWYSINTFANQVIHESFDDNGNRHGEQRIETLDGELKHLEAFDAGANHGPFYTYADNGLTIGGEYDQGKRVGAWVLESYRAGIYNVGEFRDGQRVGEWREYVDGRLRSIQNYDNDGELHGLEHRFEPNGALATITRYHHGARGDDGAIRETMEQIPEDE